MERGAAVYEPRQRAKCYNEARWDEQPLRDLGDPSIGVEGRLFLPMVVY